MYSVKRDNNFISSFLSPWLLTNQETLLYQDAIVYCNDEIIKTNRLVIGLIFTQLGCWDGSGFATVEVILPDWNRKEVEEMIARVLGGQQGAQMDKDFSTFTFNEEIINCANTDICGEKTKIKTEAEDAIIDEEKLDDGEVRAKISFENSSSCYEKEGKKLDIKNSVNSKMIARNPKSTEKWDCTVCNMTFSYITQLRKHALEYHKMLKFLKCKYCDFETNSNKNIKRHANSHTKAQQYHCDKCDKTCLDKGDLKTHKSSHSTTGPLNCDICNKSLKSSLRLRNHKNKIHNHREGSEQHYICEVCSSVLKTKDYLRHHMKNVHTGYLFMCSMCEKKFKTKGHLKDHEKGHRDEIESTECTTCGFVVRGNKMTRHMKTHSNTNSLKCDKCDNHFRSQSYLIKHIGIAHTE